MPVPKLLKSVPFLTSIGCVGVGGTGVAIWQTLKTDSRAIEVPDTLEDRIEEVNLQAAPTQPRSRSFSPSLQGTFSNSQISLDVFKNSGSGWDRTHSVQATNNVFGLKTGECFSRLFPESRFVFKELSNTDSDSLIYDISDSPRLVENPKSSPTANAVACSSMNLQYKSENFLFRSEIAAKNDNFGFSLLTGLKGKFFSESEAFESRVIHYLTFFEEEENGGNVKGGYSGGGAEVPSYVSSLHITSPDGTINKTFSKDSVVDTETKELSYSGVGATDESGSELINFDDIELWEPIYDQDGETLLNVAFPLKISGYKDANVFYEIGENKSWDWKKYEMSAIEDGGSFPTKISSSVSKWTEFIKDKKGTWKSMSDYCTDKQDLDDSEKSKSICYQLDNQ